MPEPIVPNEPSVDVPPNADNGNLPVDQSAAPQDDNQTPAPAEPTVPVEPAPAAPAEPEELYELPDGRKVDGATLAKEWKENFLPDYTRKSQALAEKEKGNAPNAPLQDNPTNPLDDPNWQPSSYAELVQIAEQRALKAIEEKEQARIQERQAIEDAVSAQLTELKAQDANLNENALFQHATKYGFRDLKAAYANMKDMSEMAKNIQQTTAKNVQKRNDPVSVSPGASGSRPDPSNFENARDYLRSLQG